MGIQFHYPVLWLLAKHYTSAYNVPNDWWKEVLLSEGFKVPGTEMAKEYDLAQLQEAQSLSNLDLQRRRVARGCVEGLMVGDVGHQIGLSFHHISTPPFIVFAFIRIYLLCNLMR